ncbi:MAG: hypothetical protein RR320_04300 [Oscillospiraceae bacterium]
MSKGNALGMIAISRKAGRLKMGFDPSEGSLGHGAVLLLFASDVSPKTKARIQYKAEQYVVPSLTLPYSADEVHRAVGKRVAVMAVTDQGLADRITALTAEHDEEEFDI